MKVVLGLGNPGRKYEKARHNLGYRVIDRFAVRYRVPVKETKYESHVGRFELKGERVLLVKPQTYVNESGRVARSLLRYLPIGLRDLVVIHDDLDLPFGRIRIRPRGGAGGHRGVLSILGALGDENFFRVRVGIGRPPEGVDPADYVLAPFSPDENATLEEIISRAADAVSCLLEEGPERAMEKFNRTS